MARFVLTAQLQLQAPTNTRQVVGKIRNQLAGQAVRVPVEVKGAKQAQRAVQNVTKDVRRATSAADALGRSFGLAIKRFAAFTVASRAVSLFTNSLASAVDEAIKFQREVIKIAQVLQVETRELRGLQNTITDLSTSLGVVSKDLLAVTRILSQAGIRGSELEVALSGLAKSTLAPTFDDITQTAEGAVAILAQFQEGVGALESQLGAVNAVAGEFAVESGDLIAAVRRFGGVFKSAGGNLNELLALFTSVRATTRESAESIATGLRTIFTRIQRPATIQYLRELGVELTKVDGSFVGPFEAAQRLGKAFADLPQGDTRFVAIAEELGGFRQIGKVIPLLQQYELQQKALITAQEGANSLTRDAERAQEALAVQITKTKEEFLALVRGIADTTSFQVFTKAALGLARAFIEIAENIKPLIPLLGAVAAFKFAKGFGSFLGGAGASVRGLTQGRNAGGKILGFNRGGFVPGTGNRDTVPAMLQPGEFVIRKSSAQKLGAGTLQAMNENRFALGGTVGAIGLKFDPEAINKKTATDKVTLRDIYSTLVNNNQLPGGTSGNAKIFKKDGAFAIKTDLSEGKGKLPFRQRLENLVSRIAFRGKKSQTFTAKGVSFPPTDIAESNIEDDIKDSLRDSYSQLIPRAAKSLASTIPGGASAGRFNPKIVDSIGVEDAAGKIFEGAVSSLGAPFDEKEVKQDRDAFDFPKGIGKTLGNAFKEFKALEEAATDAKKTVDVKKLKDIAGRKTKNFLAGEVNSSKAFQQLRERILNRQKGVETGKGPSIRRKAAGGSIGGTDTVPALLTPGEFVVNKKSAQSIGYGNLASMNRNGVKRFAQGGAVGIQTFQGGGVALAGQVGKGFDFLAKNATTAAIAIPLVTQALSNLGDKSKEATDAQFKATVAVEQIGKSITQLLIIGVVVKKTLDWINSLGKAKQATDEAATAQKEAAASIESSATRQAQANSSQAEQVAAGAESKESKPKVGKKTTEDPLPSLEGGSTKQVAEFERNRATQIQKQVAIKEQEIEAAQKERDAAVQAANDAEGARQTGVRQQQRALIEQKKLADENADHRSTIAKEQQKQEAINQRISEIKAKQAKAIKSGKGLEGKIEAEQRFQSQARAGADAARSSGREDLALSIEEDVRKSEEAVSSYKQELDKHRQAVEAGEDAVQNLRTEQTKSENTVEASTRAIKDNDRAIDRHEASFESHERAVKDNERKVKENERAIVSATNKETKAERKLARARKLADAANDKAIASEKRLAKERRRAFAGRAGKAAGRGLAIGAGAFAAAGALAQSINGFVQELSKRKEEQLRDQGDVAGSAKAAEAGAVSEGIASAFTLPGLLEIVFGGKGKFAERVKRSKEIAGARAATETANLNVAEVVSGIQKEGGEFRDVGGELKAGEATRQLAQSAAEARAELSDLDPNSKERKQLEAQLNQGLRTSLQGLVAQDVSLQQAEASAIALAGGSDELQEEYLKLVRTAVNLREAQKELAKANFDSLKITSAFGGANAAVEAFTAGLETGSSSLDGYITQLESARNNIGVDAGPAIDALERELVATAGGNKGLRDAIQGQAAVARAGATFSQNVGSSLDDLELSRGNPGAAAGQLRSALAAAIPEDASDEVKRSLRRVIEANVSAIKPEDIATTDISELVKKINTDTQKLNEGFFQAAKLQSTHNTRMANLYKDREAIEQKAAEALNKAIDTQLQAAKEFEAFGGERLTTDQQLSARVAQFNNIGGAAGAGLRTGDAGDIRRVAAELQNTFNTQQQAFVQDIAGRAAAGGGAGIFSNAAGVDADQREEAKRANAALIQFTQQRIALLKEEISIVQAKNREEKNALDKLITGDIQGFIQGQAAAGAGAALRSGSQGLSSLFSASALGAGFKSLEGQGLSDQQLRRAEDLTLGNLGIQSTGVLSETTPELEALKAEGRELARVTGDIAGAGAQFELSEIAVAKANITAQEVIFQGELSKIASRNTAGNPLAAFARGGMVYANRGMFVPRGTDTVPAMLTPGEFVVNRAAVQRGNNLQLLRAMNTGGGASGPGNMSGGGRVGYYQTGGVVEGISSAFADSLPQLRDVFNGFSTAVDRLVNTQFNVKLDTTNVNVNLNGASFLATLKEDIKKELLDEVAREIGKAKPNSSGDLELRKTVL